jgi:hypothetical protein
MINDSLLSGIATLLAGSSFTIPSYLAFGSTTGTLTATDVVTSGEFDRNALDTVSKSSNSVTFTGARLGGEATSETINVISLVNTSTLAGSNDVMSNFLVSSLIHTTSFDITVQFTYTISGSKYCCNGIRKKYWKCF